MVLWAMSDSYRFGISVPDEDPPGNHVTTRAEKFQLLSHRPRRFTHMLTPRKHPGVFVSTRIPPPCPILLHSSNNACTGRVVGSAKKTDSERGVFSVSWVD